MEIKMPKLGESVHEGTIEQWLVSEGDTIDEYDPICEVITDKVTAEVPSTYAGTISKIVVEEGETIEVGEVICHLDTEDDAQDESEQQEGETENTDAVESNNSQATMSTEGIQETAENPAVKQSAKNNGRYSPVVMRLASEHDLDLTQIEGTGFEGRVTKKDVEQAINQAQQTSASKADQPSVQSTSQSTTQQKATSNSQQSIPIDGVRKQIAKNMVTSVTEIPHAWMMIEADATSLVQTRNHYKAQFKAQEGYNLTYFSFFIKAVAEGLRAYPLLNSSWQGSEIVVHDDINISIAVADENKLYVPVIKHADEKSIKGIAREINTLATKARQHKLETTDMQDGTFTVNNTGTFGSVSSMGIINHPQAAILQVESIVKKPVVIDNMIAIRDMVNLCLSIDHRILDGLQAGRFMQFVKDKIESYAVEHTNIY
ncbi:2-oxoisovalerate dehydrogenase E2 component (dihydrolipoyl transacylase) [Staphylococcus auricularis]|uniref:Dihydrolipoamide acetyltransferase component of pyruvate dehydrogenase complex n=1 Tax=Staphylococcus auricularis TaxID=29379 RepID=A0AAP8PMT9_9STAP|nr:dihydrolipoamide acetyltransferase family protein [Staphylococcus auricularis]MBM0867936.1 2-oxo acid dehydrogenase subunit E2 [Staphylococcus auricularis]MDC6326753.1 dihydrolipoamide acetyltransferase family protein [Staphylococcus auricularis]MDN4532630.1 dihydrolipoamide acetyltransferase family protein [Staphylococcus auricularis]PNZ66167.1 2-oxo acid dehydrogenase subunit E2 [Staphylococcus auricularis]QPT05252.1 2-oxo acid dehydrogenase subunit E2 [Staphylococcus auricularis]